jgi:hypothetical protein
MWLMLPNVDASGCVPVLTPRSPAGRTLPAERVQDVEAAHPFHARADVADDVIADVPDVRVA